MMDPVKRNWKKITAKVSQGPIDDPAIEGNKALTKIKGINLNHFTSNVNNNPDSSKASRYFIHPESYVKLTWDILCMIFIIYLAITVPYKISFNIVYTGAWAYIDIIITLFFLGDMIMCFFTGFYSKGALVVNRKSIAKHYLRFWFWLDLLASIPYTWFVDGIFENDQGNNSSGGSLYKAPQLLRLIRMTRFLRVLRLLRLAKLKKILMKIEDYIASNTLATLFVFARLLSVVFFIAHWTACWWFYVGSQDMAMYPVTWITKAKIENDSIIPRATKHLPMIAGCLAAAWIPDAAHIP